MNFKIHKDKLPQNTINEIRNILSDLGFFVFESEWHSFTNNCHSVCLGNDELKCFTNGKGISKQYALASAYAEFMERLQGKLLISKNYGIMKKEDFSYPDDIEMTLGSYAKKNRIVIENIMESSKVVQHHDFKIKCFPAYDVFEGKVEYLPYLISSVCYSNGFCAGNTPEEALCQGICEIFERFVIREIYFNKLTVLPNIPISLLKDLEIYGMINEITNKGHKLIIKYCTLNGKFPVVGVILLNKIKDSYIYSFGSDPIFEVALQRCLTELFQGIDTQVLLKKSTWIKINFLNEQFTNRHFLSDEDNRKFHCRNNINHGKGELPNYVLTTENETEDFKKGFQDTFKNHSDSLKFLTEIVKRNDYKIYIRNLSNLGFPTFHIFIPGLSELNKINNERFRVFYEERKLIKTVLLRLKKSSEKDIRKCADILEPLVNLPEEYYALRYIDYTSKFLSNIIINKSSHFRQFNNINYLLGMLFFRVRDYNKAFKYFDIYIKEVGNKIENMEYYSCVLLYLRLKTDKKSENEISTVLNNTYGEKLSQEVIDDLSKPEDCFKYFVLPECGDCSSCPINKECYYEKWKEIYTKIFNKIKNNPINQDDISKIF